MSNSIAKRPSLELGERASSVCGVITKYPSATILKEIVMENPS